MNRRRRRKTQQEKRGSYLSLLSEERALQEVLREHGAAPRAARALGDERALNGAGALYHFGAPVMELGAAPEHDAGVLDVVLPVAVVPVEALPQLDQLVVVHHDLRQTGGEQDPLVVPELAAAAGGDDLPEAGRDVLQVGDVLGPQRRVWGEDSRSLLLLVGKGMSAPLKGRRRRGHHRPRPDQRRQERRAHSLALGHKVLCPGQHIPIPIPLARGRDVTTGQRGPPPGAGDQARHQELQEVGDHGPALDRADRLVHNLPVVGGPRQDGRRAARLVEMESGNGKHPAELFGVGDGGITGGAGPACDQVLPGVIQLRQAQDRQRRREGGLVAGEA